MSRWARYLSLWCPSFKIKRKSTVQNATEKNIYEKIRSLFAEANVSTQISPGMHTSTITDVLRETEEYRLSVLGTGSLH